MNSDINTDIFYKASNKKKPVDDVYVSSSIFTSSTPSKQVPAINDNTESAFINKKLMNIHKNILESDFLPINNTETDSVKFHSGGKSSKYTSETIDIPINYSESSVTTTTVISPYNYGPEYGYESESGSSSSTSSRSQTTSQSQTSQSQTSSHTTEVRKQSRQKPKKKTAPKKATPKKPTPKKPAPKKGSRKGSKKGSQKGGAVKKPIKKGSKKGSKTKGKLDRMHFY